MRGENNRLCLAQVSARNYRRITPESVSRNISCSGCRRKVVPGIRHFCFDCVPVSNFCEDCVNVNTAHHPISHRILRLHRYTTSRQFLLLRSKALAILSTPRRHSFIGEPHEGPGAGLRVIVPAQPAVLVHAPPPDSNTTEGPPDLEAFARTSTRGPEPSSSILFKLEGQNPSDRVNTRLRAREESNEEDFTDNAMTPRENRDKPSQHILPEEKIADKTFVAPLLRRSQTQGSNKFSEISDDNEGEDEEPSPFHCICCKGSTNPRYWVCLTCSESARSVIFTFL